VFDRLLPPEHDQIILDLLFELATWHLLAKLRLHTDSTLTALEASTNWLGSQLRKFASVTCETFETRELPSEEAQRGCRQAALAKKKDTTGQPVPKKRRLMATEGAQGWVFSLNTYKLHALGDYANTIHRFGTADGYSTQLVLFFLSK